MVGRVTAGEVRYLGLWAAIRMRAPNVEYADCIEYSRNRASETACACLVSERYQGTLIITRSGVYKKREVQVDAPEHSKE